MMSNPAATVSKPISATNGMSMQNAKLAYKNAIAQNPNDLSAGEQQFHEEMAKYGLNGPALLEAWHGTPQTSFRTGSTTAPGYSLPMSLVGTDKSGGTPPPGFIADERGQSLVDPGMSYPKFGNDPGYSTIGPDFRLPDTAGLTSTAAAKSGAVSKQSANLIPLARIRDAAQKPGTQADADKAQHDFGQSLVRVGESQVSQAPVSDRERFQGGVDVAQANANAIAQGRNVYHVGTGTGAGVTGTARYADRVAFMKSLANERVDDGKGGTRKMTYDEKHNATKEFFGDGAAPAASGVATPPAQPPAATGGTPSAQPSGAGASVGDIQYSGHPAQAGQWSHRVPASGRQDVARRAGPADSITGLRRGEL